MNPLFGILLATLSTLGFSLMGATVRYLSDRVPIGELVFARNFVVLVLLVLALLWRRELTVALRTTNLRGHAMRSVLNILSIFCTFAGLARLPLADTTAIMFATPLFTVAIGALFLGEVVRGWRWSAVLVGLVGVLIMLSPHLGGWSTGETAAAGAMFSLVSAFLIAVVTSQIRHLSKTESTPTLVLYYSIFASVASFATIYWGWVWPASPLDFFALICVGIFGGMGQVLITESVRYAPVSTVAPFNYASMIWAVVIGYLWFGELPQAIVFVGAAIVMAAGLFVIWRERKLGVDRRRAGQANVPPPAPGAT